MKDNVLEIRNLCASYDESFIENVNLTVTKGEIHLLVGENGSGKSLFFEAISGRVPNISGCIVYQGKTIELNSSFRGIKGVSYIQKRPKLVDSLSAAENLFLFEQRKRNLLALVNTKNIYKITKSITDRYGIEIDPRVRVATLNREEKKILEVSKFQLQDNQLTVFYEPTDDMSLNTINHFSNILLDYKRRGKSFLIITEQWEGALKIADTVSVMARGRVVGSIAALEAKEHPYRLLGMLKGKTDYEDKFMDTIFKAAEFLTSEYELNDVLLYIARQAAEVMNAQRCVIGLFDWETSTIIDQVAYDRDQSVSGSLRKDAIIRLLQHDSEFVFFNRSDPDFPVYFEGAGNVRTVIFIPISIRSYIAGFMQLLYVHDHYPTEEERLYMPALARQAGIAIENTRLMGRSVLLMESHHRIKNNLQSIVSLINIQKSFIKKRGAQDVSDVLDKIVNRISSIACVHDLLSKDKHGRSILNVRELIQSLANFYYNINGRVELELDVEDIFISYSKATAIALIVNELVSNAFEHAFYGETKGVIQITCKKENDRIELKISDNGKGIPPDFNLDKPKGLGLYIVKSIVKNEFQGEIRMENRKDAPGAEARVVLAYKKCLV